ncbi:MAG TPA: AraC family transcriptional regulator [Streptosporangiaceae bacterium]|nr:AraC family transcriptional regulator [Streptosporangiaceae bacterium]
MADDWSRYWRSAEQPLEAMHAHFERHVYHRHSHETYSFGVTEAGAQTFTCRGAAHTSAAGMIMAFNPDDPHDGHAADETGFTYRMVHVGPELVTGVLADVAERRVGRPLFAEPVLHDLAAARSLRALHAALLGDPPGSTALRRDELLAATVTALVRRAASRPGRIALSAPSAPSASVATPRDAARLADRARRLIDATYLEDISAESLAAATGRSRFTVYRAFTAVYGMAPSDYQRQLRLREARRLLALGRPIGEVAAQTGFADQGHLTRWFGRYYGVTPGGYRRGGEG